VPDAPGSAEAQAEGVREQIFTIMLTTKGAVGWNEALDLPEADRQWLYERCRRHAEELEHEMDKAKQAARSASRRRRP